MVRDAPAVLGRLPEQYFTRILAAAAAARARPGPRFIDLGRGNPDLPPPPHALQAAREALLETATPAVHGYPPFDGQPALRAAIARRYALDHGIELDPDREVDGARACAAELWSPSKIYGMAGWRVGFLVGNAELVSRVQMLLDHTAAGVFTALQRGLQAALEGDQDDVAQRREVYQRRRDVL